jgi:hypothetical protein
MTGMTGIWLTYAVTNIMWQFILNMFIKDGFVHGQLRMKHPDAYKRVVERSTSRSVSMESAFRTLATVGMNVYALPIALIASILVLLFQQV